MKKADRVAATTRSAAVPSLGVQLRLPPGGDAARMRAGSLYADERGCLYEAALRLVRGL